MKISEIHVDRFGVWQNLSLPSLDPGLNVIYGPNETGKSTLMRFIRGVLYGYRAPALYRFGSGEPPAMCEGRLRLTHEGEEYNVRRSMRRGESDIVFIGGVDNADMIEATIQRLLSRTSEAMFERLFAVDLLELQELATLGGEELAEKVYGLTLGPEGRTIRETWADLKQRRLELLDSQENTGRLADLFAERTRVTADIEAAETLRERHAVLSHERDELQAEIERRKARQIQLHSQQHGHRFLEQAWPAWNRVQEIHRELAELPNLSRFPKDGLQRLRRSDDEIETLSARRRALTTEAKEHRQQLRNGKSQSRFLKEAAAIEAVCERSNRLRELNDQLAAAEKLVGEASEQRNDCLHRLGSDWSPERLAEVDASPDFQLRLLDAARGYHGRLDKRGRLRRRYKLRAAALSRQSRQLQERRKALGDATTEELLDDAEMRLMQLGELRRLQQQEAELAHRQTALSERMSRIHEHPPLPPWAMLVLGLFGVLGVIFALIGFYTGLTNNGIVGLMYALLGVACGGTAVALKTHVETTTGENSEKLAEELRDVEIRLREIREESARQMAELSDDTLSRQPRDGGDWPLDELKLQQVRRLAELEQLAAAEQRLATRRHGMTGWRGRLQQVQRDVISARQAWTEVLAHLKLSETLRVDEAFHEWNRVLTAKQACERWDAANRELNACRKQHEEIAGAIGRLAAKLEWGDVTVDDMPSVLEVWRDGLENERNLRNERRRLYRDAKSKAREAANLRRTLGRLRMRRSALLAQAGATSRAEFEELAGAIDRRHRLESELFTASAELEAICRSEPELAIVEEDMLDFDPDENLAHLERIAESIAQAEGDLQSMFERLGSVKREISELETDRRATCLRFNRVRIDDELTQTAEEWFALELAARALGAMQQKFEREQQPATLAEATKYLTQMTRGRYRNIWTQLGEQRLCVDDDRGQVFRVEQLSSGTREQLFLAIRLAVVKEMSREGIELPMVLDDVFANFDHPRTEAAIETLREFADRGQQILFLTCHLHLASQLDAQGVNTIWLPDNRVRVEERRAG